MTVNTIGYATRAPRRTVAGSRNAAAFAVVGRAIVGAGLLLVGRRRRGFELGRGPIHVQALEEVLEDLPLTRALGAAERGRGEVAHVEPEDVGGHERLRALLG